MQGPLTSALALAACLLAVPVAAQTADVADDAPDEEVAFDDEAGELDEETVVDEPEGIEVRVIGRRADAMQKVPGSGTVITPEEIERSQPQNAAEILRRVPGVNVRQDSGAGGRLDIGLRGLDPGRSRRVLLLEDGVPISNNPYAEPDLYWSPPAERWAAIEVVKGSGSILFGPQTVGGVINFATPYAPWRREVTLDAKGGQRGLFQGMARYGDRHGDVGYVAQVLVNRGDGFRAQGFRTVDSFAKVELPTGDSGLATLKLDFHDALADADDVGVTSAMFAADPHRPTLAPINQMKLRRFGATVIHEQILDERATLRTLAYGYAVQREWRRQDYVRFPVQGVRYERIVGDTSVPGGAIYFEPTNRVLDRSYIFGGLEPRLQLRLSTGAVDHTIDLGARFLGETAHYEQRAGQRADTYAGDLELDESRSTLAGALYLQDRLAFADELILVTPGVRLEYARYDRRVAREQTAAGPQDVDTEGSSDVLGVIPGVGMTAGLPEVHGFGGVHVGFAPPRVVTSIAASGRNAELDDERSITYEAGLRAGERGIWQLEAAGFLNTFFNQIVPSSVGAQTTLVNGGKTRQLGMESAGRVSFGHWIAHGVLLDLGGRYTLMRAEFDGGPNDGNRLPYAPSHLTSATLDLGHDIGLSAQVAYRFVGSQFADDQETVPEDITGRQGLIDAYHRLDLNLRYREKHSGLTASLAIKDVIDQPFVISRRPEGIFAAGFRQIIAGLRWDYAAGE